MALYRSGKKVESLCINRQRVTSLHYNGGLVYKYDPQPFDIQKGTWRSYASRTHRGQFRGIALDSSGKVYVVESGSLLRFASLASISDGSAPLSSWQVHPQTSGVCWIPPTFTHPELRNFLALVTSRTSTQRHGGHYLIRPNGARGNLRTFSTGTPVIGNARENYIGNPQAIAVSDDQVYVLDESHPKDRLMRFTAFGSSQSQDLDLGVVQDALGLGVTNGSLLYLDNGGTNPQVVAMEDYSATSFANRIKISFGAETYTNKRNWRGISTNGSLLALLYSRTNDLLEVRTNEVAAAVFPKWKTSAIIPLGKTRVAKGPVGGVTQAYIWPSSVSLPTSWFSASHRRDATTRIRRIDFTSAGRFFIEFDTNQGGPNTRFLSSTTSASAGERYRLLPNAYANLSFHLYDPLRGVVDLETGVMNPAPSSRGRIFSREFGLTVFKWFDSLGAIDSKGTSASVDDRFSNADDAYIMIGLKTDKK